MSSFDGLPFVTRLALLLDPGIEIPLDKFIFTSESSSKPEGWMALCRSSDVILRRLFIFHQVIVGNEEVISDAGVGQVEDMSMFRVERVVVEGLIVRRVIDLTGRLDLLLREHTYAIWQTPRMKEDAFIVLFREVTKVPTA